VGGVGFDLRAGATAAGGVGVAAFGVVPDGGGG